ncbi:MAG: molybdopterin molybdotransferase MoeA [Ktedonobacterales bacterium]|nr:molybdopterin molybdotransferase MoeA [Ktedonobacterales bacterium]
MLYVLSVDDALKQVVAGVTTLPVEFASPDDADGRILASDIVSPLNLPPFANSAMDGYALRAADTTQASPDAPVRLLVSATIAAGARTTATLRPCQAAKIMTGAPIPLGADAVIKYELVTVAADGRIELREPCALGNCVRQPGEDVQMGRTVLMAGTVLTPAGIGVLASLGRTSVPCVRRPRVALLGTGDELAAPGQPLAPGQIYDTNTPMLAAYLRRLGAEVVASYTLRDRLGAVRDALQTIRLLGVDLIVSSGGISTGDFDVVKDALQAEGAIDFWQIRMRPGKPLAFGRCADTPFIGLPGNPLAAFVGCTLYVQSVIRRMQGLDPTPPTIQAICQEPIRNGSQKRHFLRGTLSWAADQIGVRLAGGQLPTQFSTVTQSTCLIIADEGRTLYEIGECISVIPLSYAPQGFW